MNRSRSRGREVWGSDGSLSVARCHWTNQVKKVVRGEKMDQIMRGTEGKAEWTGLCPGCGRHWKGFRAEEDHDPTRLRAKETVAASWTGDKCVESGRPEVALPREFTPFHRPEVGTAVSTGDPGAAMPTLWEGSSWPLGDRG